LLSLVNYLSTHVSPLIHHDLRGPSGPSRMCMILSNVFKRNSDDLLV